jgi:hypothetical protein
MYWIFRRGAGPGTGALHADDIDGIRAIYGSGVGSVTPLLVPEPAAWIMISLATMLLLASRAVPGTGASSCHARLPIRPLW